VAAHDSLIELPEGEERDVAAKRKRKKRERALAPVRTPTNDEDADDDAPHSKRADDDDEEAPVLVAKKGAPKLVLASDADEDEADDEADDADADGEAPVRATGTPRRARRRPRVEHVSTPPMPAEEADSDDKSDKKPKRASKKPAKKKTAADRLAHLPLEITGIVLFAIAVLCLLSLLSYSSGDTAVGRARPVENWIGPGGALLADLLTLTLGFGAVLVPVGLFLVVAMCFRPVSQPRYAALRVGGGVAAGLSILALLHLALRASATLPFPAGGLLGAMIANGASSLIAPLGTAIVATAVTFVGGLLALDRPVGPTTRTLAEKVMELVASAQEKLAVWREERRLLIEEEERLRRDLEKKLGSPEEQKADKRAEKKKRISDEAEKRAKKRLEDEDAEREALKQVEVAPVGPSNPPIIMADLNRPATMIVSTPSAPGTLVEPATNVADDPPWVLDEPIVDGDFLSLAKVLEKKVDPSEDPADDGALVIHERVHADAKQIEEAAEPVVEQPKQAFALPPLNLLDYDAPAVEPLDEAKMRSQADKLIAKFKDFGIDGRIREIRPGPVCTTYELVPAPGIKVSKIAALADDIAMAMEAVQVRIVAPIPGKGAVGIEIPNEKRETVYMKEIIADPAFKKSDHKLMMALGKDIEGRAYYANLAEMPHVLISGTTGSGKSVSVNAMICSILYRASPEEVRFIMIDPKMLELSIYEGIPHLLVPPIIDSKKAAVSLRWAVQEMERRYQLMSELGVRDMAGFNTKVQDAIDGKDDAAKKTLTEALKGKPIEKFPYIVIVVDEYADLLAVAGKDVEGYVMRLAQKARAAGLHVMLATQRPSVDVITGVIKANFPVRMGFRLASNHDSKTIINRPGAEKLLGRGDMLFMPPGTSNVTRVHGAFISEKELHRVVEYLKEQRKPQYNMDILTAAAEEEEGGGGDVVDEPKDSRYDEALAVVARTKKCSTSWLQRMMNLGYQRAARIVDRMERDGHVGPALNAKGDREIYVKPEHLAVPGS
jgi:DNA segregation ATPase FtsK/SpoIIIE, S-DNA-T family